MVCEHTQLQGLQDITAVQLYIHLNFGLQIDGLDTTRQLNLKPSTSWWVNHYKLMLCSQTLFEPAELDLKLWERSFRRHNMQNVSVDCMNKLLNRIYKHSVVSSSIT